MKFSFKNDYSEMTHPKILDALSGVGNKQFEGYGLDEYSVAAAMHICKILKDPFADVHFIPGGTHANLVVIASALRPHEAVIAPKSGHIFVHEAGAVEATGHKVCTREGVNGKLSAADIESVLAEHPGDEHMVKPRLVYISLSTECGTVYTKAELAAITLCCRNNGLYLYIDGARLSNALVSGSGDLTLETMSGLADAFYIGGTKNGLLFGEALVIVNPLLKADFRYLMKQRGGLLAKGFLLGIQFRAYLEDGLYIELARHANGMATRLREGLRAAGVGLFAENDTNQVFLYARADALRVLDERVLFERWGPEGDEGAPIRFVTSWATTTEEVDSVLGFFAAEATE